MNPSKISALETEVSELKKLVKNLLDKVNKLEFRVKVTQLQCKKTPYSITLFEPLAVNYAALGIDDSDSGMFLTAFHHPYQEYTDW